ncbi:LOW QUALITY PROTEIN: hypothetical protein MAR_004094 [Mya arenaria]|uniref:Uncharacterized protein n=1 Tax=Mya arenaria TaxID=6604 RepID=A0ABY7EYF1_MYAAR|nr:LOW QUALITY PROTEIN: hypothetical protein MAR_004094 [Mya arenaria]
METQATYTLSQLVKFNTKQRCRSSSTAPFHSKSREFPLPMYDYMLKLELEALWIMKQHGVSISYNRVLELSTVLGNNAIRVYESQCCVSSTELNNIDLNPSSTSSQGSFHGTSISLFQQRHTLSDGIDQRVPTIEGEFNSSTVQQLPVSYRCVNPVGYTNTETVKPCPEEK